MQLSSRLQYLDALGIDTWVPRVDASADWQLLQDEVSACVKCGLAATRTRTVFGVGNPHADWLVIGEAPGAEEDRQGKPFVGAAGKLLDAMLQAIGLSREQNVFITNMLKCRPPGNRDPKAEEIAACLPYLMRQIAAIKPKLIALARSPPRSSSRIIRRISCARPLRSARPGRI